MSEDNENIYKRSRRKAGLTQEAAAPCVGVSVESLRAYETNQRIPPSEVVLLMTAAYRDTLLGYHHLGSTNPLAQILYPAVEERSLIEAAVRIHNCIKRMDRGQMVDRLMEIAEDGVIDEVERKDFDKVITELHAIVQHTIELGSVYEGSDDT